MCFETHLDRCLKESFLKLYKAFGSISTLIIAGLLQTNALETASFKFLSSVT